MTILQQRTLTRIRRAGISIILALGLMFLGIVTISYRAANTSAIVDRPALLRSMSVYDRPSDELLPECMIHVCVQRLPALNADASIDEPTPECMVHTCTSRSAAPSAARKLDELIPDCMLHVCVIPPAASVYDGR